MAANTSLHPRRPQFLRSAPLLLAAVILIWYIWFMYFSPDALFTAAVRGNPAQVKAVLSHGVPVDASDPLGKSNALMMATVNPYGAEICSILLDRGANVNARNMSGKTALIMAAYRGRTDIVLCLLSRGADVNATDNKGRTALYYARKGHYTELDDLLKQAGAK